MSARGLDRSSAMESSHLSSGDLDEANPFREETLDDDAPAEPTASSPALADTPAQDLSSAYHVEEVEHEQVEPVKATRRVSLESLDRPAKDAIQVSPAGRTSGGDGGARAGSVWPLVGLRGGH